MELFKEFFYEFDFLYGAILMATNFKSGKALIFLEFLFL